MAPEKNNPKDGIAIVIFLPTLSLQGVITIVTMLAGTSVATLNSNVHLKTLQSLRASFAVAWTNESKMLSAITTTIFIDMQ